MGKAHYAHRSEGEETQWVWLATSKETKLKETAKEKG